MLEDLEQFPLKVRAGEDEGDILAGLNARELEMALDLRPWMQVPASAGLLTCVARVVDCCAPCRCNLASCAPVCMLCTCSISPMAACMLTATQHSAS